MKHIGLCTQDGPEEKTGEMRFRLSTSPAALSATLSIAGIECTYEPDDCQTLIQARWTAPVDRPFPSSCG